MSMYQKCYRTGLMCIGNRSMMNCIDSCRMERIKCYYNRVVFDYSQCILHKIYLFKKGGITVNAITTEISEIFLRHYHFQD